MSGFHIASLPIIRLTTKISAAIQAAQWFNFFFFLLNKKLKKRFFIFSFISHARKTLILS